MSKFVDDINRGVGYLLDKSPKEISGMTTLEIDRLASEKFKTTTAEFAKIGDNGFIVDNGLLIKVKVTGFAPQNERGIYVIDEPVYSALWSYELMPLREAVVRMTKFGGYRKSTLWSNINEYREQEILHIIKNSGLNTIVDRESFHKFLRRKFIQNNVKKENKSWWTFQTLFGDSTLR